MGAFKSPAWTNIDEPTGLAVLHSVTEVESTIQAGIDVSMPCIPIDGSEPSRSSLTLHERLPAEVVQRIFILCTQDHGIAHLPFGKSGTPPQQAASHVCSAWRQLALCTGELWNNVIISKLDERMLSIAETWLRRAGKMEVTLKVCLLKSTIQDLTHTLQNLCRPLHLRRLDLMLTSCQLAELSAIECDETFPYLEDTRVVLYAHKYTSSHQFQPFFSCVQYLFCASGPCLDLLYSGHLPTKELRHLDIECVEMTPTQLIGVLSQAASLESCRVLWYWEWLGNDPLVFEKDIILPNMRALVFEFHRQRRSSIVLDAVTRHLVFPNLKKLALRYRGVTSTLLSNISERFNLSQLEELELHKTGSMTVTEVLNLTPLLRQVAFSKHIVFDEEAMVGLSTGSLGRYLTFIKTNYTCDSRRMFAMVASRQKISNTADAQNVVGSYPKIVPLHYVYFRIPDEAARYAKDLDMFKQLGTDIVMNDYPQERIRQFQILETGIPNMWSEFVQPSDVY